jgi:hypothetical protein
MKSVKLLALILSVLVAVLLLNCDNATAPDDEGEPEPESFDFPHPDGGEWVYKFNDLDWKYVVDETVQHYEVGDVIAVQEWWKNEDDTEWNFVGYTYLWFSEDEIRAYYALDDDIYKILFKFPLEVGKSWKYRPNDHPDWTATVLEKRDSVTVPAGTFNDVWIIDYYVYQSPPGDISVATYYVSGVGGLDGIREVQRQVGTTDLVSYNQPAR